MLSSAVAYWGVKRGPADGNKQRMSKENLTPGRATEQRKGARQNQTKSRVSILKAKFHSAQFSMHGLHLPSVASSIEPAVCQKVAYDCVFSESVSTSCGMTGAERVPLQEQQKTLKNKGMT